MRTITTVSVDFGGLLLSLLLRRDGSGISGELELLPLLASLLSAFLLTPALLDSVVCRLGGTHQPTSLTVHRISKKGYLKAYLCHHSLSINIGGRHASVPILRRHGDCDDWQKLRSAQDTAKKALNILQQYADQ